MKMDLDKLMPHRTPMRLIRSVVDLGRDWAVTESMVLKEWPLCEGDSVSPIVLIELVAQSATVFLGWREFQDKGEDFEGKGWLVGVRKAVFHCEKIDLNTVLRTEAREAFEYDLYHEIAGTITAGATLLGKVTLQVVQAQE